ncbi:MAG: methyltransferase domain-containing protein [Acidobacteria bacterium]|nr:methyltransferase domain-containing protein [Acidobacteriota bacterium]
MEHLYYRSFFAVACLALLSWGAWPAAAQGKHPVSGRQYAWVMGAAGADWLVRPEREQEENPDLAVSLLGLRPGMVVADIGAGVGYYSLKMAAQVGDTGKVYASDLQPEMLRLLRKRLEKSRVSNVIPVLGSETETNLPDGSVDLAVLVDVYHEFSEPRKMLASLARALKPDGRLVLLEFRKEDPKVPIREEHKMSVAVVRQELEADGYVLEKLLKDLPWQHVFFFKKANRPE